MANSIPLGLSYRRIFHENAVINQLSATPVSITLIKPTDEQQMLFSSRHVVHYERVSIQPNEVDNLIGVVYRVRDLYVSDIKCLVKKRFESEQDRCLFEYYNKNDDWSKHQLIDSNRRSLMGKSGLLRKGLMKVSIPGCIRAVSVVHFNTNMDVDEIGISQFIADNAVFPRMIRGNRVVTKKASTGDLALVVRNPTLTGNAVQLFRTKILPNEVCGRYGIAFPAQRTSDYAADFDGDTESIWLIVTPEAIASANSVINDSRLRHRNRNAKLGLLDLVCKGHSGPSWIRADLMSFILSTFDIDQLRSLILEEWTSTDGELRIPYSFVNTGVKKSLIKSYLRVPKLLSIDEIMGQYPSFDSNLSKKTDAKSDTGYWSRLAKTYGFQFEWLTNSLVVKDSLEVIRVPELVFDNHDVGNPFVRILSELLRSLMQTALKSKMVSEGTMYDNPISEILWTKRSLSVILVSNGSETRPLSVNPNIDLRIPYGWKLVGTYNPRILRRSGKHGKELWSICDIGALMILESQSIRCTNIERYSLTTLLFRSANTGAGLLSDIKTDRHNWWVNNVLQHYVAPRAPIGRIMPYYTSSASRYPATSIFIL